MENKILWTFPVPSNCINTGIKIIYEKIDATILFDYYDEDNDDKIYDGKIIIKSIIANRHTSEKVTQFIEGTYDNLCEIKDSIWLSQLSKLSPEWISKDNLKHYAIYLDSYGLYEFIAEDFSVTDINEGTIDG